MLLTWEKSVGKSGISGRYTALLEKKCKVIIHYWNKCFIVLDGLRNTVTMEKEFTEARNSYEACLNYNTGNNMILEELHCIFPALM